MSHANPTPLLVGATGTLDRRRMRVAGRVVMGMEEDGETYYWSEFNLVDGFGRSATLVYEETDDGPEWKLFKPFVPLRALTAAEAAAKRVGATVALDGQPAEITLVGESRVHHLEGVAPEGVEVGDVANYFNVDTGERMLVVSWTGDEIEFFEGFDLPAEQVGQAFGFAAADEPPMLPQSFARSFSSGSGLPIAGSSVLKWVGVALTLLSGFSLYSCNWGDSSVSFTSAPVKQSAPAVQLATGAQGTLAGRRYTVMGRALVETARVGRRHDQREYALLSDRHEPALLVNELLGTRREWHLFELRRDRLLGDMGPYDAATQKTGTALRLGHDSLRIVDLCQVTALSVEAADADTWPRIQYGFLAEGGGNWLAARWTEAGLRAHVGRPIPESEVLAAFGAGSKP